MPENISSPAVTQTLMKPANTSKPFFSQANMNAALAAAKATPPAFDPDNPPTTQAEWKNAFVSHSHEELKAKRAARRAKLQCAG